MKRKETIQGSQYRQDKTLHPTFLNPAYKRRLSEASVEGVEKRASTEKSSNTAYEQYFQLSMGEIIRAIANKNSRT